MGDKPPEIVTGLTRVATWIHSIFGIPCSRQIIKHWQKEVPPFPAPVSADYRYRWSEVSAWVERHKARPRNGEQEDLFVRLDIETAKGKLEKLAHERVLREVEEGKFLPLAGVQQACGTVGKIINGILNNRLEVRLRTVLLERFKQSPVISALSPDQVAAVMEAMCAVGRETSATIKGELRTGLNAVASAAPKEA